MSLERPGRATGDGRVLVQLDLLADDGTLLPKEFEACIFTGSSYKGSYKLEQDAGRLRVRRPCSCMPPLAPTRCAPIAASGCAQRCARAGCMHHSQALERAVSTRS